MDIRASGLPGGAGFWSRVVLLPRSRSLVTMTSGCNDPLAHVLVLPSIIFCLLLSQVQPRCDGGFVRVPTRVPPPINVFHSLSPLSTVSGP